MRWARDAVRIFFGKYFPNRVTAARLRRKENSVHHLNESKSGKFLLSNCGKWRQNPVIKCDKLRQIRCRLLSLNFDPHLSPTISLGDGVYPKTTFTMVCFNAVLWLA
jgi:hypothetical protein